MSKYGYGRETFVNPYHFVSLDGDCNRERNYEKIKKDEKTLTGWIECELETLTPIFIPNSSNDNAFKKFKELAGDEAKSYDFFSYEDIKNQDRIDKYSLPIIPGSEIKGMIRSAFEAVTNSCLSTIEEEKVLYKRVQHPAKPGRLVYEGENWKIKECSRFRLPKTWVKIVNNKIYINGQEYKENNKVYVKINYRFKVQKISKARFEKAKEGFLHIGEYNDNKNYESVFVLKKDKNGKEIEVVLPRKNFKKMLINLIGNILLYRQKINKTEKHNRYRHFDETFGKIQDISHLENLDVIEFNNKLRQKYNSVFNYLNGALIYYTERNGKYYLSPAAIGREVFYNKLQDVIKVKGYEPCDDIKNLCPACALFGMVKGKKAVASRVRFTDAFPEKKQNLSDYYDDVVILSELASPKLSATEFYLKKPDDAHLWNYDYAGKWEIKNGRITSKFIPFKNYQPQIRGRKFYWHQNINKAPGIKLTEADNRREEFSDRNVAIRPLKKGIKFSFRVYFNDIIEDELRKLMWMLEISGNKVHAHKIGMGKPIGLGSVQISVKGAKIRRIMLKDNTIEYKFENKFENFEDRLNVNEQNCQNTLGCSQKVFKEFMTITNFKKAPENISYPKNENQEKNYYWFVANRQVKIATATCPIIYQSLPLIDRPELKKYKIKTFKSVFSH